MTTIFFFALIYIVKIVHDLILSDKNAPITDESSFWRLLNLLSRGGQYTSVLCRVDSLALVEWHSRENSKAGDSPGLTSQTAICTQTEMIYRCHNFLSTERGQSVHHVTSTTGHHNERRERQYMVQQHPNVRHQGHTMLLMYLKLAFKMRYMKQ